MSSGREGAEAAPGAGAGAPRAVESAERAAGGAPWQVWADTGGTFTDCVAVDPRGVVRRAKVLSSGSLRGRVVSRTGERRVEVAGLDALPAGGLPGWTVAPLGGGAGGEAVPVLRWDGRHLELGATAPAALVAGAACELAAPEEAPVVACRLVTGTAADAPLPPIRLRLATTLGTNALLERRGTPPALLLTAGFGDLLAIGTQQRPDLFALAVEKAAPLHASVLEVEERVAAGGETLCALRLEALEPAARAALATGSRTAAVSLLHAYRHPQAERAVAAALRGWGFEHVAAGAELAPLQGYLARTETAVVDAYLGPLLARYLRRIGAALGPGSSILVMTSAGGLVGALRFAAHEGLLSGPAAGVVGAQAAAARSGLPRVITFDMGGTSTDVARCDGELPRVFEHRVGDARLLAPAVALETVAAGGGSICSFDGHALQVGPESGAARPGPACYGAGGPLCVTDVNLLLGRLADERFEIPLDRAAAEAACAALEARLAAAGAALPREELLAGLLRIADERMAEAIRQISVRQGYDPAEYALLAFGGAGAQHACSVASLLGIRRVAVPRDAGLLSAAGLGAARLERARSRQVLRPLAEVEGAVAGWVEELAGEARGELAAEGVPAASTRVARAVAELRYAGQESTLEVPCAGDALAPRFAERYRALFGYEPAARALELVALRVVVAEAGEEARVAAAPVGAGAAAPRRHARGFVAGAWRDVPVFDREAVPAGATLAGPALVLESHATTVVDPGWSLHVDGAGALILERESEEVRGAEPDVQDGRPPVIARSAATKQSRPSRDGSGRDRAGESPASSSSLLDPVSLELFTHRFAALARLMGESLRRTAVSTNVKERLDFSCALLDPQGRLVVNAPHIPVHLGALGLCVRAVAAVLPMGPGDVVVTNHPAFGGSHLPDVTVITPVFDGAPATLLGYVASRAHHAEIGGARPGSMPPSARTLAEEGVVLAPRHLLRAGEPRWVELEAALREPPYPTRALTENLADLAAAVAANHQGAEVLLRLARAHGAERVWSAMDALRARSAAQVRAALRRLGDGVRAAEQRLDDGTPLRVRLEVQGERLRVDFTGSGAVHPGNLNATPAIVRAVVLYVLRLLVAEALPLNEGLLEPVELVVPHGSLLDPEFPADPRRAPAVVGGNVETSQRLVDTLLLALGLVACSQGTMNNVLFGDGTFGYYETVCGGCGAGPGFAGASAVHSHMTNTRITDPEVLEQRFPVRLDRFAVRRGSGGAGAFRGGDGAVRELTFLAPVALSIVSQHRVERPYGLAGGAAGERGRQRLLRADGRVEELASVDGREVEAGDRLLLETPGGGGWGEPGL